VLRRAIDLQIRKEEEAERASKEEKLNQPQI